MPIKTILVLLGLVVSGCTSFQEVDRSLVNRDPMNLRESNILDEPAPSSGLRNMARISGGGACSTCAK